MLSRRPQVLADSHDLTSGLPQLLQQAPQLPIGLPDADHESGFDHCAPSVPCSVGQHLQRPLVVRLWPQHRRHLADRLDIVVEDRGPCRKHCIQRLRIALEVRRKHFDAGRRQTLLDGADGASEVRGSAVRKIIARDRCDDYEFQPQVRGGFGYATGLIGVEGPKLVTRLSVLHCAEAAVARAGLSHQHERGRVIGEALADIRTARILADGIQSVPAEEFLRCPALLLLADLDPQPGRQSVIATRHPSLPFPQQRSWSW